MGILGMLREHRGSQSTRKQHSSFQAEKRVPRSRLERTAKKCCGGATSFNVGCDGRQSIGRRGFSLRDISLRYRRASQQIAPGQTPAVVFRAL